MRIPLRSLYLGIRMQKIEMCQDYEGYIVQAATVKGGVIVSNDQYCVQCILYRYNPKSSFETWLKKA